MSCQAQSTAAQPSVCASPLVTPSLLAIYALAFDNEPGSPSSLSAYFTPTLQSIISATVAAPDRVAVILADLDAYGDTRVIVVQNGVVIPVEGLPTADDLHTPVALDPFLTEYDMADGWYLGNFMRWARQLYPADQTLFSFVGHGAPLTPQLHPLYEGVPPAAPTTTPTPVSTPAAGGEVKPLPPRWWAHSDLTDAHSASLISVRALAQALSIATADGAHPLAVVDLLHCFSATIEELYEIHPYAQTIVAAPNYTYAEPTMLGEMLALLDPTQTPATLAQTLVEGYDRLLPADGHPRLFIAVDANKIAPIKQAWDQTATGMLAAWQKDESAARAQLLAAYRASAKYDTTICQPQDWQLAPPDALSDMTDFAFQLSQHFGAQSAVGAWALTTTQTIADAIIARHGREGTPWFAPAPATDWRFPGAGIALFTDFAPTVSNNRPQFSWQSAWYTHTATSGNPYPYTFIQPSGSDMATWADLFSLYWGEPITSTAGCIQGVVHGRGPGSLWLTDLAVAPSPINGDYFFTATVYAGQAATNPLLGFRVHHNGAQIFENVVGSGYISATMSQTVQSNVGWTPAFSGDYLVEAMIDLDNRFTEEDETDNALLITVPIRVPNRVYLPVVEQSDP